MKIFRKDISLLCHETVIHDKFFVVPHGINGPQSHRKRKIKKKDSKNLHQKLVKVNVYSKGLSAIIFVIVSDKSFFIAGKKLTVTIRFLLIEMKEILQDSIIK